MSAILVVTPSHRVRAALAVAANRAGETGLLDLGYTTDADRQRAELALLRTQSRHPNTWGVRWDALSSPGRSVSHLASLLEGTRVPILLLAGVEGEGFELGVIRQEAASLADQVYYEAVGFEEARAAQHAGFDGVVVKGFEAGGRVGLETTFCLLQRLQGCLSIPYWVQGGIGPDTAASALLAGARGIVLCEQLWLAAESPLSKRKGLPAAESIQTVVLTDGRATYRVLVDPRLDKVQAAIAYGSDWQKLLIEGFCAHRGLAPVGQDASLAGWLAAKHINVAGILKAYRLRAQENFKMACRSEAFAPASALAESHGTKFPIVQGAVSGITDQPAFCELVESNGALAMLSLGGRDVDESRRQLSETKTRLEGRPWGVALAARTGTALRGRCLELIAEFRPPFALLDALEVDRVKDFEHRGIATYVRVDSPENIEFLLAAKCTRFVFEGSETGGPLGPWSSFSLWQHAIDALMSAKIESPESLHLIFAGPIHDSLSAAMTAAAIAPLTARGMKVGLQLGSAYFFTPESVAGGIVTDSFHQRILQCRETVVLSTPSGPAIRSARTPFVDEYAGTRADLVRSGLPAEEVTQRLRDLIAERITLAAKGRLHDRAVDDATQQAKGLYQVGEVAVLRHQSIPMRDLHEEVAQESVVLLESLAAQRLPWQAGPRKPRQKSDDIAIVGMACMFPKAKDLRKYWQNICQGVDAIEEVPAERWDPETFFDSDRLARDRVYSKWGGFLDKIVFDPMKWRIPPASLKSIEPIQLLSLEVAARAMQDAGYDKREFHRERTGVIFACAGSHDLGSSYAFRTMMRHFLPKVDGLSPEGRQAIEESLAEVLPEWTEDSFPGFLLNVIAGRIARELNLNGPNYTVDAACAASMAAFHAAIEQLRSGTSDMMLVGGADGTNNPFCYMSFSKTHALSPRGRSRPFDESGDGIALGEGIGVVVLKRLKDAEADGDKIYAVIRGIGSSSDGKNKSLTAPYPPGQIKAVERAYDDAQVSPTTVSLIEAHGTGTVVGDSAEITTLNEVFRSRTSEKQFAAVGSVKSMIGHTKTVAGMASMIKTAMALHHRVLPPTIGVEKPTSRFDFKESPFYINSQTRPWIEDLGDHPRRAGVSAFGFGGTNFHFVLEEYTGAFLREQSPDYTPRPVEIFAWTRSCRDEVKDAVQSLARQLDETIVDDLAALGAAVCRDNAGDPSAPGACRLAIVAASADDLKKKLVRAAQLVGEKNELVDPTGIFYSEAPPVGANEVCFLYPGQGSQYVDMMRDVLTGSRWGQAIFSSANRELAEFLPKPLSRYIYPPPVFTEEDRKAAFTALSDTRVAQPALGVVELFATELLERFGIRPGMAAGHSYGEHVALYAAGVISREELIWLSAMRGQVCADIAATSPGGMAAVQADAAKTEEILRAVGVTVYLANRNAPDQTIIAGSEADVDLAVERIAATGVRAKRIAVSAPFHTPLLEAGSAAMAEHFAAASFQRPKLPVYSNTTGKRHSDNPDEIRDLLARHFSEPVYFEDEVRQMYRDGAKVFIECGPGKVLSELVGRILKGEPVTTLSIDVPGRDGWTQLGHALARAFVLGLPVRTAEWSAGRGLPESTTEAIIETARQAQTPKRSDWILGPSRAEPVSALGSSTRKPKAKPVPDGKAVAAPPIEVAARSTSPPPAAVPPAPKPAPSIAPPPVSTPAAATPSLQQVQASQPALDPMAANRTIRRISSKPASRLLSHHRGGGPLSRTITRKSPLMTASSNSPVDPVVGAPVGPTAAPSGTAADLYLEFQASTRMFLEFQNSQQILLERFLETQERLLLHCLGAAPANTVTVPRVAFAAPAPATSANGENYAPSALAPVPPVQAYAATAVSAPPAAIPAAPAPVQRPPISVPAGRVPATAPPAIAVAAPRPAAMPAANAPEEKPVAAAKPAAPIEAKATTAAPAAGSDGPPPLEVFRKDLLAVISERTGYPEDMLDETLPLEAGLGIDSIKTVEIFSTLKQYHRFMREEGRDEEEALAEFTSLKTIKDILDSYERRIADWKGNGAASSNGLASANGDTKNGHVERHTLAAEAAPLTGGSKKNSRVST